MLKSAPEGKVTDHLQRSCRWLQGLAQLVQAGSLMSCTSRDVTFGNRWLQAQLGRDFGGQRWGPRPIDLDIIFYAGDVVVR